MKLYANHCNVFQSLIKVSVVAKFLSSIFSYSYL